VLVPRPSDANLVRSMWLFKHKFHADGTLSRYKARLVANVSSQQLGVDFDETFSPVVKLATIHTVLSLSVSCKWSIHQLDVKNAFLNGDLSETVAYLLLYVDDIILTASTTTLLQHLIDSLHREFDMTDLGVLNYFLGISAVRQSTVDTESKLGPDGVPVQDPTLYRSLAGGTPVSHIYMHDPDLSYAVQQICLYMHDPREPHLAALKLILQYVHGSLDFGRHLYAMLIGRVVHLHAGLPQLHSPLLTATLVYCDNVSAIYMSANPVQHQRMKHIKIDIHFVRDMVTAGQVRVLYVPSHY
ncbi:ribonuclease H-like domain-containing protein, partial [Tanacetum coccineum]